MYQILRRKVNQVVLLSLHCTLYLLFFSSCDKVKGPTREVIAVDTNCHFASDNSIPLKKVLVEDYAGHFCGNCPGFGLFLNDSLKPKYNDSIIIVTVHAGYFAGVCPTNMPPCTPSLPAGSFKTDFTCSAGNDWNVFFGITGNPKGMVDRMDYANGIHAKSQAALDPAIQSRIHMNPTARIRIQNTYTDSDRKLRSCIEAKFLAYLKGKYKLSVVLTEDSIVDWQVWYSHTPTNEPNYLNHHILRTSLNTSYGVQIIATAASADSVITTGYSTFLNPSWNVNHCNVVAFIYNDLTKEVIQVEEAKVR